MPIPLSYPFLRYMESTRHLVLYRLNSSYPVPPTLRLPQVETLCLLDCAPDTISSFLYRPFFPGLQRIHYLSVAPSDALLYRRFPSVDWVFPYQERAYPFYDAMMEAGKGRMEQGLLSDYIAQGGFHRGGRRIVSGYNYAEQQRAYLHKKYCDAYCSPYPIVIEDSLFLFGYKGDKGDKGHKEDMIVLTLPDATPYHNSNK